MKVIKGTMMQLSRYSGHRSFRRTSVRSYVTYGEQTCWVRPSIDSAPISTIVSPLSDVGMIAIQPNGTRWSWNARIFDNYRNPQRTNFSSASYGISMTNRSTSILSPFNESVNSTSRLFSSAASVTEDHTEIESSDHDLWDLADAKKTLKVLDEKKDPAPSSGEGTSSSSPSLTTRVRLRQKQRSARRKAAIRKRQAEQKSKKQTSLVDSVASLKVQRKSRKDFEDLFDRVASRQLLPKLNEVVKSITSIVQSLSQDSRSSDASLPIATILLAVLNSTNTNEVAKLEILEFLLSTKRKTPSSSLAASINSEPAPHDTKVASDGTENTRDGDKQSTDTAMDVEELDRDAVDIMMSSRTLAVSLGLWWNKTDKTGRGGSLKKKKKKQSVDVPDESSVVEKRHKLHQTKSEDERIKDAEDLVLFLSKTLPKKHYQSVIRLFESYSSGDVKQRDDSRDDSDVDDNDVVAADPKIRKSQETIRPRKSSLTTLRFRLEKASGSYFPKIAHEVAEFFYLNDGVDTDKADVVSGDPKFLKAERKWNAIRRDFASGLMEVQEALLSPDGGLSEENIIDSDDDSKTEEDIMREIEEELMMSPQQTAMEAQKHTRDRRFRRPYHLVFEAETTHTQVNDAQFHVNPRADLSHRMAFIDNLPIDITEARLMELYSRCGAIDEIQVFNQRPDLDPGPLSWSQLAARRRNKIKSGGALVRRWKRPRTPVYALLTFQDIDGYMSCTDDSLRIFGMLIAKHDARSIRATDVKNIYMEGIPKGTPVSDFEYLLREELLPGHQVCLKPGQNRKAHIGSCRINFSSFEAAFESFERLQQMELVRETPECLINWLRTPKDAEEWWTRAKGFD